MNAKMKMVLGIALVAVFALVGCGKPSKEATQTLEKRYREAGGFGLGQELAKTYPNAKVLAIVPGSDHINWAFYEGFKAGAGSGLTIVEASEGEMSAPPAKGLQAKLAEKRKAAAAGGKELKRPVTGGGIADAMSKKGSGCTLVVSFLGLPTKRGPQGLGEDLDTWTGIEKVKVAAVMGSLPPWLKGQMKGGPVVAVIVPTSDMYSYPKDADNAKLFQKCWKLVTPANAATEIR